MKRVILTLVFLVFVASAWLVPSETVKAAEFHEAVQCSSIKFASAGQLNYLVRIKKEVTFLGLKGECKEQPKKWVAVFQVNSDLMYVPIEKDAVYFLEWIVDKRGVSDYSDEKNMEFPLGITSATGILDEVLDFDQTGVYSSIVLMEKAPKNGWTKNDKLIEKHWPAYCHQIIRFDRARGGYWPFKCENMNMFNFDYLRVSRVCDEIGLWSGLATVRPELMMCAAPSRLEGIPHQEVDTSIGTLTFWWFDPGLPLRKQSQFSVEKYSTCRALFYKGDEVQEGNDSLCLYLPLWVGIGKLDEVKEVYYIGK